MMIHIMLKKMNNYTMLMSQRYGMLIIMNCMLFFVFHICLVFIIRASIELSPHQCRGWHIFHSNKEIIVWLQYSCVHDSCWYVCVMWIICSVRIFNTFSDQNYIHYDIHIIVAKLILWSIAIWIHFIILYNYNILFCVSII